MRLEVSESVPEIGRVRYSPSVDESELLTVCNIIEGAIWYTAGEEVEVEVYLKSR